MQKLTCKLLFIITLTSCTSPVKKFIIEGKVPAKYDGNWIYLAPIDEMHSSKADSFKINKGTFTFTGTKEQMCIIRTKPIICFYLQKLLVVTELGHIKVVIDSISSASGTPQNNALQQWKEQHEKFLESNSFLNQGLKNVRGKDSVMWAAALDSLKSKYIRYNYNFLKQYKHCTLGVFIYKLTSTTLTPQQLKDLDENNK
jgi:hypothetical protein